MSPLVLGSRAESGQDVDVKLFAVYHYGLVQRYSDLPYSERCYLIAGVVVLRMLLDGLFVFVIGPAVTLLAIGMPANHATRCSPRCVVDSRQLVPTPCELIALVVYCIDYVPQCR
jgi:hypothetical protein